MKKLLSLCVLFALSSVMYAQKADDLIGVWLTKGGKSKIEISKKDGKYYGSIVWLEEPNNEQGKPKVDKHNSDEDLRTRPLLGLKLLEGFEWDDGEYEDGTIYDPESGKTYSCEITYEDLNTINVRGYIGFSMMGRSTVWTRVK